MTLDPIRHLLATVPEFRGVYEQEAAKWDPQPIPNIVICSDIFSDSVSEWMKASGSDDSAVRAFQYIEDLAADNDENNQYIAFYFLEHFGAPRALYLRALQYVGPHSKEMLLAIRRPIDEHRLED